MLTIVLSVTLFLFGASLGFVAGAFVGAIVGHAGDDEASPL
jgi:hypothetical protein